MSKSTFYKTGTSDQFKGQRDSKGFFVVTIPSREPKSTSKDLYSAFEDFENSLERDKSPKIETVKPKV